MSWGWLRKEAGSGRGVERVCMYLALSKTPSGYLNLVSKGT